MNDGSLVLTVLRAVISLAIVLGLLILMFRLVGAKTGLRPSARTRPVDVDLLGRRQLTRGSQVCVVRVGGAVLVLGVTDSHISVLSELAEEDLPADEDSETSSALLPEASPAPPAAVLKALRSQGRIGRMIADRTTDTSRAQAGRHRGGRNRT